MLDKELAGQIKKAVFLGVVKAITPKGHAFICPLNPTKKDFESLIKRMKNEEAEVITLKIEHIERSLVVELLEFLSRQ